MKIELVNKTLEQVKQSYDSISSDFARTRQRSWVEVDFLIKKYVKPRAQILDAGCGNGRLLSALGELNLSVYYTGLDNSENLLAKARENFGLQHKQIKINWQAGRIEQIPLADKSFDIVFAIASWHHLPSTELRLKSLAEFKRVLKPGGILLMTNWNLFTWRAFKKYKLWKQAFNFWRGFEWGDFVIPWKDSQGNLQALRYYHSFSKKEINKLLLVSKFKVLNSQNIWLSKHSQSVAKSIITVARTVDN